MISKWIQNPDTDDVVGNFLVKNIWIPLFFVNLVLFLCVLYFIFAMTQTSLRFLYIDVFYVNIFSQLVRIFFSVYMLVIIFVQHTYFISDKHMLVTFKRSYIIIADECRKSCSFKKTCSLRHLGEEVGKDLE